MASFLGGDVCMREQISRFLDRLEARWSLWERLGIGTYLAASFGIPAWAAAVTNFLQQYSPISWVAAGFFGVLIAVLILYMLASVRDFLITSTIKRRFYESNDRINPLQSVFQDQRIQIADLMPPFGVEIEGKTFIRCELVGPANVVLMGGRMANCSGALVDAVCAPERIQILNAIAFKDCTIESCKLFRFTFIVPVGMIPTFRAGGVVNWISLMPP
jgi:hypothetical protein